MMPIVNTFVHLPSEFHLVFDKWLADHDPFHLMVIHHSSQSILLKVLLQAHGLFSGRLPVHPTVAA